jgi:hypothetical protein
MDKMKTRIGLSALAIALGGSLAWAAGFFPNVPVVGGPSYCNSFVNGTCAATTPAGASALTGSETIAADTGLAAGAIPQTELVPTSVLGLPFGINRLVGGDMMTNLAQRLSTTKGIASLASLTPTAAVMNADGWWEYSASGNTTVTMGSGTTEVLPALGSTKALRLARTSGTTGAQMCLGQTLDQNQAAPLIGQNAVFSLYELNGAGQSATGGNFTIQMSYSANAAAAGTQATLGFAGSVGSKYAIGTNAGTFGTGGPTNQTATSPILVSGTTGTIGANGFVTIAGSTTWTRYAVAAPIPAFIPGTTTAVTDVSVEVCFTPAAATAITTDWIEVQGLQLEAKPSTVTPSLPSGVVSPTAFERRPASVESLIDYSYWYYNFENQSAITAVANCVNASVTVANCNVQFPVPMRIVPAVAYTSGFQAFTTTGYSAVNACTLAVAATYAVVPSNVGTVVQCTATTIPAAGTANILTSLGTSSATGIISASAYP